MPDQKLLTGHEIQAIARAAAEKIVDRQSDPTKRFLPDTVCPQCGAVEYLVMGDDSTWSQEADSDDDVGPSGTVMGCMLCEFQGAIELFWQHQPPAQKTLF